MGNRVARAVLICGNPSRLLALDLAHDRRRMVALGITKQLSGRVLMRHNHLTRRQAQLITSREKRILGAA